MGTRGYWAPQVNSIANGKKIDLTPYPGNSLNRNLLSQSAVTLCDSPYVELEEHSPSEGLGVRFLLFREEKEAIEQQVYWEIGKLREWRTRKRKIEK